MGDANTPARNGSGREAAAQDANDWIAAIPVIERFAEVVDPSSFVPVPETWWIGISDVVDSTQAIADGRYKAVNLAGAGTISGVQNALGGDLKLFIFCGDGARFLVSPEHADRATDALRRVAMWAKRDLGLELRVGMIEVGRVRDAGCETTVAYWQASNDARYALLSGGGVDWAETQLKSGATRLDPAAPDAEPDLSGLSCQWDAIRSRQGSIVSLIVRPGTRSDAAAFARVAADVIALLERGGAANPVPADGPEVRWPSASLGLQSRIARRGSGLLARRCRVLLTAILAWIVFRLGVPIGGFVPDRYRREVAANTDFRKFDDGLLMTVDCAPDTIERLRGLLRAAQRRGLVRYGLHVQDQALMTCVVPSVLNASHMHFVDGGDGGYASAASKLRG